MHTIELHSPAFDDHAPIPREHSHASGDVSPPLEWSQVPDEAVKLALVCEDPDAPLSEPFVHWLVYDIPPGTHAVTDGARFTEGKSSVMQVGFTPAAPPPGHGVHHYHFQVFALDTTLDLAAGAGRSQVLEAMDGHVVAWGDLVGTYQRS